MENIPNCFYRISIKALILDENREKFLVVQEDNGKWEFPGGGLDFKESYVEGLKREIKEEMGLEVTHISLNPVYFLTDQMLNGVWYANVFYEVQLKDFNFIPSDECVALKFVKVEDLKNMEVFPNVTKFGELFSKK